MKAGGPFRPGPPPSAPLLAPPVLAQWALPLTPPLSTCRPRPHRHPGGGPAPGWAWPLSSSPAHCSAEAPPPPVSAAAMEGLAVGGRGGGAEGGTNPPGHPHMGARIWEPPPKKSPSPSPSGCPRMLGGHSGGFMGSPGGGILCWGCGAPGVALWLWGGHPLIRCSFPPPPQVLSALLGARRPYSSVFRVRRSGGGLYWGPSYGVPQYRGPFGVFPSA